MAIDNDRTVVYIDTDSAPKEVLHGVAKMFGGRAAKTDDPDYFEHFRIVDCFTYKVGAKPTSRYWVESISNLNDLSMVIQRALEDGKEPIVILDDVSSIALDAGADRTIVFIRSLLPKLAERGILSIHGMTTGVHDPGFEQALRMSFESVLELKLKEGSGGLERFIRIFSLRGIPHSTQWVKLEITEHICKGNVAPIPGDLDLRLGKTYVE